MQTGQDRSLTPNRGHGRRLPFLDAARSFAILGAVGCHVLLAFAVLHRIDDLALKAALNGIFRVCAPLFFMIFGVLLELVYVRKWQAGQGRAVSARLAVRSLQCLTGYLIGVVCAVLGGNMAAPEILPAVAGFAGAPMVGVLRFYAMALLIAIPLLACRVRFGPAVPLVLLALIWIADPLVALLPLPPGESAWGVFWGRLIGRPHIGVGGSTMHNFTIVLYGLLLGQHLRARQARELPLFGGRLPWLTIALCGGVVAVYALQHGPLWVAEGFLNTRMTLRVAHHPAYYAIVIPYALAVLWVAQRWQRALMRTGPILSLGRYSLMAFTLGNAPLAALPAMQGLPFLAAVGVSIAYMAAFVAVIHIYAACVRKCPVSKEKATAPPSQVMPELGYAASSPRPRISS
ncbi:MAG: hypothetical protein ACOCZK_06325 [Planctomycetota bacterium]